MECGSIQEKLSAYIDDILSSEERSLIDQHIKICDRCKESLSELRKTIEHVKTLEEVEPPAWMTQNIMTKIRAEAEPKKGILQRLFYPLHIKVPIQAVATIVIAITAVYIFRSIPPDVQYAKAPPDISMPRISAEKEVITEGRETYLGKNEEAYLLTVQEDERDQEEAVGELSDIQEETVAAPADSKYKKGLSLLKKDRISIGERIETPSPPAEPQVPGKAPHVPESHYASEYELAKTSQPADDSKERKSDATFVDRDKSFSVTGAMKGKQAMQRAPAPQVKSFESVTRKGIEIKLTVKTIKTALDDIENAVHELKGKIIISDTFRNNAVLTAQIDSQKIDSLHERLKEIGELKETTVGSDALEGAIEIRIEITRM